MPEGVNALARPRPTHHSMIIEWRLPKPLRRPYLSRLVAGRVAQLVRALLSHSRGPGFESLHAHKTQVGAAKRGLLVFYTPYAARSVWPTKS